VRHVDSVSPADLLTGVSGESRAPASPDQEDFDSESLHDLDREDGEGADNDEEDGEEEDGEEEDGEEEDGEQSFVLAPATLEVAAEKATSTLITQEEEAARLLEKRKERYTMLLRDVCIALPQYKVIFIAQRKASSDVFAYYYRAIKENDPDRLQCIKVSLSVESAGPSAQSFIPVEPSPTELGYWFGVDVVEDNSERDYPTVMQMIAPASVTAKHSEYAGVSGDFKEAVCLSMMHDVIFDVWSISNGPCWITTTIAGLSFAVVEHLIITIETESKEALEVDLTGRHPRKNLLIDESYQNELDDD